MLGAFFTVLCLLPDLLTEPIASRPRLMAGMTGLLQRGIRLARHRRSALSLGLCAGLCLLAISRVRVDDDIQGLIQPSRALQLEEARIHALTGLSNSASFFLVEGRDEGQLLEREEALGERLRPLIARGCLDGAQAISAFVPSPARQEANLAAHRRQAPLLRAAMAQVGFKAEIAQGLLAQLESSAGQPLTVAQWFQLGLATPYRMLWLGATAHGLASVVYPMGHPDAEQLRQAAQGLPGVSLVDKARAVSQLLGHYRRIACWALLVALGLIYAVLAWIYSARQALLALAPSLFGILLALAGLGLSHTPMTLFTMLALTLVLGFGVDYSVFLMEGGHRDASGLLGVLLAALSTLVSYGLLVFSHTPVLRGFALTLALGVLGATLTSFLALRHPLKGEQP